MNEHRPKFKMSKTKTQCFNTFKLIGDILNFHAYIGQNLMYLYAKDSPDRCAIFGLFLLNLCEQYQERPEPEKLLLDTVTFFKRSTTTACPICWWPSLCCYDVNHLVSLYSFCLVSCAGWKIVRFKSILWWFLEDWLESIKI